MKTLLRIDLETFSPADLRKCGVYPYAEHPDFEILLFGYAFDAEPVTIIDLAQGEEIPEAIVDAIFSPDVLKTAYNASFERTCLAAHFGRPTPPAQWRCTSVLALTLGMPGNLAAVSEVCNLAPDKQKMGIGYGLIRYFCIPCKPTKKNGERTRNYPHHDLAKWDLFKLYCSKDVEAERAIYDKLIRWAPSAKEQRLWELDQKINDTGIMIDLELVKAAIGIDDIVKEKLTKEFFELTGITKATQVAQIKKWLEEEHDIETEQLNKEAVKEILKLTDDVKVERAMQLRQMLSKSSVSKYHAMLRAVCADGRVRGLYQFYGANRTGRWTSRLVQTQNLARSDLEHDDLALARELVKAYEIDLIELLFGPVQQLLSELIRTAFIAPPGKKLAIVDFSAVEARGLAWGAGEEWRMEVFRTHGKIYEASASEMFKVPLESIDKKSPLRQKGKISELACLGPDTLVLTDEGYVRITSVAEKHRLWDGETWVRHQGLVARGARRVVLVAGIKVTPEHLIRTLETWKPAWQLASSESTLYQALATGSENLPSLVSNESNQGPVRQTWREFNAPVEERLISSTPTTCARGPARAAMSALKSRLAIGLRRSGNILMRFPMMPTGAGCLIGSAPASAGVTTQMTPHTLTTAAEGYTFSQLGEKTRRLFSRTSHNLMAGTTHLLTSTVSMLMGDMRLETFGSSHAQRTRQTVGTSEVCKRDSLLSKQKIQTYDIAFSGPKNCFTVLSEKGPLIVHNCGFGGGAGALVKMGGLKMGLLEEELPDLIKKWREANPSVTQFWKDLERHAKQTIRTKLSSGIPGKYRFDYESGFLFMTLPSGRRLAYVKPRLVKEGTFTNITYDGADQITKQWVRVDTFGGKLCENWDQAMCRDALGEALLSIDSIELLIVGHVHDEAIVEVDEETAEDDYAAAIEIFAQPMPWAPGLPLAGDGFISPFYKK